MKIIMQQKLRDVDLVREEWKWMLWNKNLDNGSNCTLTNWTNCARKGR
jgi:hypothetical protein